MITAISLFLASVLGAVALVLMMPKPTPRRGFLGPVLACFALGGGWLAIALGHEGELLNQFAEQTLGLPSTAFVYYYVFSLIAIVSAVRVITQAKPVYSALWFIMVVLASAGLLLVLSAEFMAFAMIMIYGGAILVTYMFVIMLASQNQADNKPAGASQGGAGDEADDDTPAEYDRVAREPLWACVAGFLLLSVLLSVYFSPQAVQPNPGAAMASDRDVIKSHLAGRALNDKTQALASAPSVKPNTLSNVERIGLDLFESHPLAIELAGVILLVSLIGAVVIAKMHVPNEDAVARGQTPPGSGAPGAKPLASAAGPGLVSEASAEAAATPNTEAPSA